MPQTKEAQKAFEVIRCNVYCAVGDMKRGLASFRACIAGENLDVACSRWGTCLPWLRRAGAYNVAKDDVEKLAKTDYQKSKVQVLMKVAELKEDVVNGVLDKDSKAAPWSMDYLLIFTVSCMAVVLLTVFLL